tara:strand:+ start:73 stop:624 length:552 start_codon:yes stop_codon:yes gene_type:complete
MKKLIYLFLALIIVACSSGDDGNDNNYETYLEIVVNGQTYRESLVGFGYGNSSQDCNGLSSFIIPLPEINTASKRYSADILHFYQTVNFNEATTGSYPIKGEYLDDDCHLTLSFRLTENSGNNFFNLTDGAHTITGISEISSDNNDTEWVVEGNFNANLEDSNSGESISLTGSYRAVLVTYQD